MQILHTCCRPILQCYRIIVTLILMANPGHIELNWIEFWPIWIELNSIQFNSIQFFFWPPNVRMCFHRHTRRHTHADRDLQPCTGMHFIHTAVLHCELFHFCKYRGVLSLKKTYLCLPCVYCMHISIFVWSISIFPIFFCVCLKENFIMTRKDVEHWMGTSLWNKVVLKRTKASD